MNSLHFIIGLLYSCSIGVIVVLTHLEGRYVDAASDMISTCLDGGNNRRKVAQVIDFFNQEIEDTFVGQFRAVREVRKELEDKLSLLSDNGIDAVLDVTHGPLVLHLVGPSGTGKSFLSQIVAKSLFKPLNCRSSTQVFGEYFQSTSSATSAAVFAAQVGVLTNPVAAAAAALGGASIGLLGSLGVDTLFKHICTDVESWTMSCGVVHTVFSETSEEDAARNMQNFLERLAVELQHEPSTVAVLDDFNFCFGKCQTLLKELLMQHTLDHPNGQKVSAKKAILLMTSDLTYLGLEIQRGEEYDVALDLVETAAKNYWGSGELVSTIARTIPFAPLTDGEIIKVVDKMLALIDREIHFRVARHFRKLEAVPGTQKHKWSGRFICAELTKMQIIDHMQESIEKKNSRAIVEEFSGILRRILRHPEPIEKRLVALQPKLTMIQADPILGIDIAVLSKQERALVYDQDIILAFNSQDPNRFVYFKISDDS